MLYFRVLLSIDVVANAHAMYRFLPEFRGQPSKETSTSCRDYNLMGILRSRPELLLYEPKLQSAEVRRTSRTALRSPTPPFQTDPRISKAAVALATSLHKNSSNTLKFAGNGSRRTGRKMPSSFVFRLLMSVGDLQE